ncbi:WD repeat-containing protein 46 [Culicoides brevitarsis]|uniref:WD repeat-containing protein 46 n=1 Tax=Culicoides brevitarsis TaxID=469753 RepID=UPI00307B68C2
MAKTERYFKKASNSSEETVKPSTKKQEKPFENKLNIKNKFYKKPSNHLKNAKIKKNALEKFDKGPMVKREGLKTKYHHKLWQERDKQIELANKHSARTEVLLNEEEGYIDTEIPTESLAQSEICNNVDIMSASKHFSLALDQFGPYRIKYNENGKHLLLGGRKGHVASVDWITKHLSCEMNVMEEISNVSWLHNENMFAVAQKSYVHIYDNKGMQLHCIKRMNAVSYLEFLPYHFLLAAGNDEGFLSWLDVSIGEIVSQYNSKLGTISNMCQDKSTGVIFTGDTKGVVSLWCPSIREPLAQLSCHNTPISALCVSPNNNTFLTSDINQTVKVWDSRNLGESVAVHKLRSTVKEISVSQKGMVALALGNVCEIYRKDLNQQPYLRYPLVGSIKSLQFCPYEDVLGISTNNEFASILVPGSAEANFDALESNPYQSKSQRRETEVRRLLDKIPMEMISLRPDKILEVNTMTFKEKLEAKKKILFVKPPKIDFAPRQKKKSKNSAKTKRKQIIREATVREFKKNIEPLKQQIRAEQKSKKAHSKPMVPRKKENVLDRFKPKSKLK